MKKVAVIVAGGKGRRMDSDIPKQFMMLGGKPILHRTIEAFYMADPNTELRLVLPKADHAYWNKLCAEHPLPAQIEVFEGGETRFHSVKNGLQNLPSGSLVGIHDGVRPLVSKETIERCFDEANKSGTAIPVVPLTESLRQIKDSRSEAVPRDQFRLVQTPQVFQSEILLEAYQQEYRTDFTDDASVVEACGYLIIMVEGNKANIKITTPEDLAIASALLG